MHYCEVEVQGLVVEECGKPASVKIGSWYCEYYANALEQALVRWSDPEWVAAQQSVELRESQMLSAVRG